MEHVFGVATFHQSRATTLKLLRKKQFWTSFVEKTSCFQSTVQKAFPDFVITYAKRIDVCYVAAYVTIFVNVVYLVVAEFHNDMPV